MLNATKSVRSLNATFMGESDSLCGGRDQQSGDEGGTWLAVSKQGRLATLLNITSAIQDTSARSRGHLVKDFVTSQIPGPQFQATVAKEAKEHNPFHLLTFEIMPEDVRVLYVARQTLGEVLGPEDLFSTMETSLTASLSNSPIHTPFRKAKEGKAIFEEIISQHDDTNKKEELISSLLSFAKTNIKFFPDDVMQKCRESSPLMEKYSSIFVDIPEIGYGTRTHTIILVDDLGEINIVESTLIGDENPKWLLTKETIRLKHSQL